MVQKIGNIRILSKSDCKIVILDDSKITKINYYTSSENNDTMVTFLKLEVTNDASWNEYSLLKQQATTPGK